MISSRVLGREYRLKASRSHDDVPHDIRVHERSLIVTFEVPATHGAFPVVYVALGGFEAVREIHRKSARRGDGRYKAMPAHREALHSIHRGSEVPSRETRRVEMLDLAVLVSGERQRHSGCWKRQTWAIYSEAMRSWLKR